MHVMEPWAWLIWWMSVTMRPGSDSLCYKRFVSGHFVKPGIRLLMPTEAKLEELRMSVVIRCCTF